MPHFEWQKWCLSQSEIKLLKSFGIASQHLDYACSLDRRQGKRENDRLERKTFEWISSPCWPSPGNVPEKVFNDDYDSKRREIDKELLARDSRS